MDKKYELTDIKCYIGGNNPIILYRIRALRSFGNVRAGDLGGFVQSEDNLSHAGTCWLFNDSKAYGAARIYGSARLYNQVCVSGAVQVYGNAKLRGVLDIAGAARIFGSIVVKA